MRMLMTRYCVFPGIPTAMTGDTAIMGGNNESSCASSGKQKYRCSFPVWIAANAGTGRVGG